MNETSQSNKTQEWLMNQGKWKGITVFVGQLMDVPEVFCESFKHKLYRMHHYGPDGKDYGPTGFLSCKNCGGVAYEPA